MEVKDTCVTFYFKCLATVRQNRSHGFHLSVGQARCILALFKPQLLAVEIMSSTNVSDHFQLIPQVPGEFNDTFRNGLQF